MLYTDIFFHKNPSPSCFGVLPKNTIAQKRWGRNTDSLLPIISQKSRPLTRTGFWPLLYEKTDKNQGFSLFFRKNRHAHTVVLY